MNVVDFSKGYGDSQSERGRKVCIDSDFLASQNYPGGEGRWAVLTYDIGVAASAPLNVSSPALSPILYGSKSIPISGEEVSISDYLEIDPSAKLIRISFTGPGDVNITYDGSAPTSGIGGEVWFKGGILEINLATAQAIKAIKAGTSNGSMYVTQFA